MFYSVNQPKPFPDNIIAKREDMSIVPYEEDLEEEILTFDDKIRGGPQFYHAYVLYALEDRDFVDEMIIKMKERGYNVSLLYLYCYRITGIYRAKNTKIYLP